MNHASAKLSNVTTSGGGTFTRYGYGLSCTDCGATTITDSLIGAGFAYEGAYALYATGDVTGMSITNTTIQGAKINGFAGGGVGAVFSSCIGSPTLTGVTISGGSADSGGVTGFNASGSQCHPVISNATIEGGTKGTQCTGLLCFSGSMCIVKDSTIVGSSAISQCKPYGVVCAAACNTFSNNTISAGWADTTTDVGMGLQVIGASPTFDSNVIMGPECPNTLNPISNTQLHAAYFSDSAATVTNNLMFDRSCKNGPVEVVRFHKPTTGTSTPLPTLYNNTVQFSTCFDCPVKRGLFVTTDNLNSLAAGIVRNNIFVNAGTAGLSNGQAVAEVGPGAALLYFQNNDLWLQNAGILYYANGGTPLTLAEINARMGAGGNISADPLLDATFHIPSNSPCRNAGLATGIPRFDFEGDPRPQELLFDIGADEYRP